MPISHTHKAIFVHIPKVAGTSMEIALGMRENDAKGFEDLPNFFGRQRQHLTALGLRTHPAMPQEVFNTYFKFTFVRNPWGRLYSEYTYLKREGVIDFPFEKFATEEFLTRTDLPGFVVDHIRPQTDYVYDSFGTQWVNFIGKFENLQADWATLCSHLKIDAPLPHAKNSQGKGYAHAYNAATKATVAKLYKTDCVAFGYTFEA